MALFKEKTITRRAFFRIAGYAILSFFFLLWQRILIQFFNTKGTGANQKIKIAGKADGIYFYDNFLLVKQGDAVKALSNKCTHAGCKINKEHNGKLICACHGSSFDASGKVIKGPALKPLEELKYSAIPETGEIIVHSLNATFGR